MGVDPIRHLDVTSPFDVIVALDDTLEIARKALATQLQQLTFDAVRSMGESYLADAVCSLYAAREQLVACVEADS